MTPEEYRNSLNFDAKLAKIKGAYLLSVKDVIGAQVVRIFEDGINSSGTKIGTYSSTKPLYISDDRSPRKGNHKGKPKDGKAKTITTTYYESYKSFRGEQGRESSFVNLRLFGRLMSDLANAPVSDSIPADVKPIKLDDFMYYTRIRSENVGKKKGADEKYGKVFSHTKEERERFNKTLKFELNKANA